MRNLKLVIEYDGTNYRGWQSQKNVPTIQNTIETSLSRILNHKVRLIGSGRTDSRVHAFGQVANFKTDSSIPIPSLLKGVNSLLPPDILIKEIEEVASDFHARYSAKSRVYEYHIWNEALPSVFRRNYSWWIREKLEVELMEKAALHLLGWHDFSSFQGSDHEVISPEREVIKVGFRQEGSELTFSIQANAFLRHMVRNIMGTLVEVGKKRISPDDFVKIFKACDRREAGITAPAKGLFLKCVFY